MNLTDYLLELGADVSGFDPRLEGRWQRLPAGKRGSRPIAVKIHRVDPLLATVGDWRRGEFRTVREEREMTPRERNRLRLEAEAARRRAAHQKGLRQSKARAIAAENIRLASPARAEHPYLVRKGVKPHGIYERPSGQLLIPMVDRDGEIWSHQTISPDGTKLYLKDGRRRGCYFPLVHRVDDLLVFAEGYATAASIHEATTWPVVVCFDAHGIKPVAEELRRKFPSTRFIFAADDDRHLPRNVGVESAREAARAIGGVIVTPQFEIGTNGDDWNDYAKAYGLDAVAWALSFALDGERHG